jgi:phosphopantothenoylcysteine decarboxylase/phosphopantothenate--cysteine ligase
MSRILLGVSGGIAAYKALEFIRLASAEGHSLRVVQTPTSTRFVGEASFGALTGGPVLTDEFQRDPMRGAFPGQPQPAHEPPSHLQLVANADLFLIAPASANTIAKLAHGLADNLLTSCALAATCPLVIAPAMNNHMYEHPATRANLDLLAARGAHLVAPGTGRLASVGEQGIGRLAEPGQLLQACQRILSGSQGNEDWSGLQVLVTAGGTREPIDSVRFLGNSSSGRMGIALAHAALERGAQVTLVAANVEIEIPAGITVLRVSSAQEMAHACRERFPACDVLLMAAAVADFRPAASENGKIKKAGRDHLTIELEPTVDVLSALSEQRHPGQTVVGFAAEHGPEAIAYGREKLASKGLDAVIFNDISRADIGFGSAENEVTILTAGSERHVPRASKQQVAAAILEEVAGLRHTQAR